MMDLLYILLFASALALMLRLLRLACIIRRELFRMHAEMADERNEAKAAHKQLKHYIQQGFEAMSSDFKGIDSILSAVTQRQNELNKQHHSLLHLPDAQAGMESEINRLNSAVKRLHTLIESVENSMLAKFLARGLDPATEHESTFPNHDHFEAVAQTKEILKKSRSAPVIIVAGMRHSGSTALYNIVRLGFAYSGIKILANYSEKEDIAKKARLSNLPALIKIHEMRDDVLELASVILTTKRDLRDTVASAVRRRFFLLEKFSQPVEYAKYNRMLHDSWAPFSDYDFNYERYMENPLEVVQEVLTLLNIDSSHAPAITLQVENLPQDQYDTTLLSPEHITDPEHNLTFRDTLKPEDVTRIELEHYAWLVRNGYALSGQNL